MLEGAEEAVVTSLLLAGEQVAAPMRQMDRRPRASAYAVPRAPVPPLDADFAWMLDVVRYVAARLAENPRRGELAATLTQHLGDGQPLTHLFRAFFPRHHGTVYLGTDGKPLLTRRQVEILREAARGLSHAEIAERLSVAVRTVTTHMDRIHRRLGVTRTMQAVGRAVALGYLGPDVLLGDADQHPSLAGEAGALSAFLAEAGGTEGGGTTRTLRRLAQFGLLLTLTAAAAAIALKGDEVDDTPRVGLVGRITTSGDVLQVFGVERLRDARALAVAPRWAELQGYTPGNVFVVNDGLPQHDLNTAEIVEFTPDGIQVGSFCGSAQVGTRLTEAGSAVFDHRGRLLVTSGALTNAVLAFTAGGRSVERFARVSAAHLAIAPEGDVCIATPFRLVTYDLDGQMLSEGTVLDEGRYSGLAVRPNGNRLVCRSEHGVAVVDEVDAADEVVRSRRLGVPAGRLHAGTGGNALLVSRPEGAVYVLDERLRTAGRIAVPGVSIQCAIPAPDGTLWVTGQME